jgi:hypothetical protein
MLAIRLVLSGSGSAKRCGARHPCAPISGDNLVCLTVFMAAVKIVGHLKASENFELRAHVPDSTIEHFNFITAVLVQNS